MYLKNSSFLLPADQAYLTLYEPSSIPPWEGHLIQRTQA